MAVPDQNPFNVYTANGVTTVFPYEFYLINADDLTVSLDGEAVSTAFTVTGIGNVNGGEVTFLTPPVNDVIVMLERVVAPVRLTEYQDNGDLLADTVNLDFDRLWMAIKQSFVSLGVALLRPVFGGPFNAKGHRIANLSDPVNDQDAATKKWTQSQDYALRAKTLRVSDSNIPALPNAAQRANKVPAFDSAGNPTVMVPVSGSATDVLLQLAAPTGGRLSGLEQGGTVQDALIYLTPQMFGAIGDGVADDTAAIQAFINANKGGYLGGPHYTYAVSQIRFNMADSNFRGRIRYWADGASIIPHSSVESSDYLVLFSGQNFEISGINLKGRGRFNDDYTYLASFRSINNSLNDVKINCSFRYNKTLIEFGSSDSNSNLSEVFFDDCVLKDAQNIFDIKAGSNNCDLIINGGFIWTSTPPALGSYTDNFIFNFNGTGGNVHVIGAEVMHTSSQSAGLSPGWMAIMGTNASLQFTSCVMESKSGILVPDGTTGFDVLITDNSNGYWGFYDLNYSDVVKVGTGCSGTIRLPNFKYRRASSLNIGARPPYIVNSSSPSSSVQVECDGLSAQNQNRVNLAYSVLWNGAFPASRNSFWKPRCNAYPSSNASIPTGTATKIPFGSVDTDNVGGMDAANNRYVTKVPGIYRVTAHVSFTSPMTGNGRIDIYVNGTARKTSGSYASSGSLYLRCEMDITLAAGDYVEVYVTQSSGTAQSITSSSQFSWLNIETI